MDEWRHLRDGMQYASDVLRANAKVIRRQLSENPKEPDTLQYAVAAIEQALIEQEEAEKWSTR